MPRNPTFVLLAALAALAAPRRAPGETAPDGVEREREAIARELVRIGSEIRREVLAGIRLNYKPEELQGRLAVALINLKPRKMKFGVSSGMVLAAVDGRGKVVLLAPDAGRGAEPGMKVQ